jgi:hypothetical protein
VHVAQRLEDDEAGVLGEFVQDRVVGVLVPQSRHVSAAEQRRDRPSLE